LLVGCSAGTQKPTIETAWSNDKIRHESFEATLRILDQHPEYVHQFLGQALEHPKALDDFLEDTSLRLEDDALARRTAIHLAAHPKALRLVLVATLDRISNQPSGENAAAQAMADRPQLAAIVISQREDALRPTLHELVLEVQKNARARTWFLRGMAENSDALTALLASDPDVLRAFMKSLGRVGLEKGKEEVKAVVHGNP
jgi:hypothetical protein